MNYLSADDKSIGDDSTVSTLTRVTMWENLVSLVSSTYTADTYAVEGTSAADGERMGESTLAAETTKGKRVIKSLILPVVLCFTLPLVGLGVLSACSTRMEGGKNDTEKVCLDDLPEEFDAAGAKDVGDVNKQSIGEFLDSMATDSYQCTENFQGGPLVGSSKHVSADSNKKLESEAIFDMRDVSKRSIEEFLAIMNEAPPICTHYEESEESTILEPTDTEPSSDGSLDVDTSANPVSAHTDESKLAIKSNSGKQVGENPPSNLLALPTTISTGFSFIVNPGSTNRQMTSNISRPVLTAQVNPKLLRFIANIKIRYESTSNANIPSNVQHSLVLNILPRDRLEADSAQKTLDVDCQHDHNSCNNSSVGCASPSMWDCHSTAQFWITFESLLKGLDQTVARHYRYYVPRTVRFLLFRDHGPRSGEVVDWWDLTVKVPLESEHERWMLGYYQSSYTVDLEDTVIAMPEPVSHDKFSSSLNETLSKSNEYEEHPTSLSYYRSRDDAGDHNHSENQDARSQESTWQKLLYGCLSGLVAGLGILVPVFIPGITRSISGDEGVHDANVNKYTSPKRQPRFTTTSPSNANEGPATRETIEHNPQYQHNDRLLSSGYEQICSQVESSKHASSLPPVHPKQNQRTARKKMYSQHFGIGLENSKTPRRGNLSSTLAVSSQTETGSANSDASKATLSHIPDDTEDETMFYSPQFDMDTPDPLPHSNTMSSQDELAEEMDQGFEEPADCKEIETEQHQGNNALENEGETISPPTIERIVEPHPFSDPPPFPASKVLAPDQEAKPAVPEEKDADETNEKLPSFSDNDSRMTDNHTKPEQNPSQESIPVDETSGLLKSEKKSKVEGDTDHTALSACEEDKETSPLFLVEQLIEASETEDKTAIEGIAPNSPVLSDATLTFDNCNDSSEQAGTADEKVDSGSISTAQHTDENNDGSNVQRDKSSADFQSQSMPHALSPRKRTRRNYSISKKQDSTATTDDNGSVTSSSSSLSMTADRPIARRSGDRGQSKKFAASPPADTSDELSFKSDSTFHDCGAERIGQRVAKDFDGVTTFGTVTEYNGKESPELWRICYDDESTHREYIRREELTNAILHYEANETNDPSKMDLHFASADHYSQQSSECQGSETKSDDTWSRRERKARDKKRVRAERRLLRTAKRPAVHKPSSTLIPLSQAIDEPVWEFSKKRKSI